MIRTAKGGQGLGKWEPSAKMVRLVRELLGKLEDGEELEKGDDDQVMKPDLRVSIDPAQEGPGRPFARMK